MPKMAIIDSDLMTNMPKGPDLCFWYRPPDSSPKASPPVIPPYFTTHHSPTPPSTIHLPTPRL